MTAAQSLRLALAVFLSALTGCAAPHRSGTSKHISRQFAGRLDGMISEDIYLDVEKGGGVFLLSTTDVQMLSAKHDNQTALGGGSVLNTGPINIKVDPQTGQIIEATGSAVGNVIGAALKTAVKP